MGKRARLQIYLDLMQTISRKHKPTQIMYATNLSWIPLTEYLIKLEEKEFIRVELQGARRLYYLTEKGMNVLNYFSKLKKVFPLAA